MEIITENQNQSKCQVVEPRLNRRIYKIIRTPEVSGTPRKKGRRILRVRQTKFDMRMSPNVKSYTHEVSTTPVPQQNLNMNDTNIHGNMKRGQSHPGPNSTQNYSRHFRNAESEKESFSRKKLSKLECF